MPICQYAIFIELTGTAEFILLPCHHWFLYSGLHERLSRCITLHFVCQNVQWWFLGVVRFLRFGWTQQSCRELDSVPCWQKRNPGRQDDVEMKWISHVSEQTGSERMRCKWWARKFWKASVPFILNVNSIVFTTCTRKSKSKSLLSTWFYTYRWTDAGSYTSSSAAAVLIVLWRVRSIWCWALFKTW